MIKKEVICAEHSLHQITCHCNCQGNCSRSSIAVSSSSGSTSTAHTAAISSSANISRSSGRFFSTYPFYILTLEPVLLYLGMAGKQQSSNKTSNNSKQSKEQLASSMKQVEKANSDSSLNSVNEKLSADNSVSSNSGWACVVCCQNVPGPCRNELYAIGPCEHPVCYECSTKMRLLCEQNECPICRQEILKVRKLIITNRY